MSRESTIKQRTERIINRAKKNGLIISERDVLRAWRTDHNRMYGAWSHLRGGNGLTMMVSVLKKLGASIEEIKPARPHRRARRLKQVGLEEVVEPFLDNDDDPMDKICSHCGERLTGDKCPSCD